MFAYIEFHPMNKSAASLPGVVSAISSPIKGVLKKTPTFLGGLGLGASLGDKQYQNSIPDVKSLPRLDHPEQVQPQNRVPTKQQQQ